MFIITDKKQYKTGTIANMLNSITFTNDLKDMYDILINMGLSSSEAIRIVNVSGAMSIGDYCLFKSAGVFLQCVDKPIDVPITKEGKLMLANEEKDKSDDLDWDSWKDGIKKHFV